MLKETVRRFFIVVLALLLALKWFWPIFLVTNLPFFVTLIRFEKDLFVFIDLYILHKSFFLSNTSADRTDYLAFSIIAVKPLRLFFGSSAILKFSEISLNTLSILSFKKDSFIYLLLPGRNRSIFTL